MLYWWDFVRMKKGKGVDEMKMDERKEIAQIIEGNDIQLNEAIKM